MRSGSAIDYVINRKMTVKCTRVYVAILTITVYSHANLDGFQLQVYLPSLWTSVTVSPLAQVVKHISEQGEAETSQNQLEATQMHRYPDKGFNSFILLCLQRLVAEFGCSIS